PLPRRHAARRGLGRPLVTMGGPESPPNPPSATGEVVEVRGPVPSTRGSTVRKWRRLRAVRALLLRVLLVSLATSFVSACSGGVLTPDAPRPAPVAVAQ